MLAADSNSEDLVKILIKYGADESVKDNDGNHYSYYYDERGREMAEYWSD